MNKQLEELKAAALAATPGPWGQLYDDVSGGDDSLITCDSRDGMIEIAKVEGGGPESGFDEPFRTEQQANARYIAAANPAAVLAMIAELESAQQRSERLDAMLTESVEALKAAEQTLNVANDATRVWKERTEAAEARLATPVRLPESFYMTADNLVVGVDELVMLLVEQGFKVEGGA